jgi:hypothetical protein
MCRIQPPRCCTTCRISRRDDELPHVAWWDDALADLAAIWTSATDRSAVNLAVTGAEEALSRQPSVKGRPIAEGLRRIDVGVIRVYFQVNETHALVEITAVRLVR